MTAPFEMSQLRIREATPEDAAAIIAYCIRITNEPHNNVARDPGQWTMTVAEEYDYLAKRNRKSEQGIYCIAEVDGDLVGIANLDRGSRLTNNLSAGIGITVDIAWRGKGIGTALMQHLLDWARRHDLVRLELNVFVRNTIAIHLYEKLGFKIEGRHPFTFCKQGIWLDELTMGLILNPPGSPSD